MIEVALFLAVTGLLFVGVTVGVQNSIYQQRYTDAVQSFADFLRNLYSETANVQGIKGGKSNKAIYGKLVSFGESTDLNGDSLDGNAIYAYDVIGDIGETETGDALSLLRALNADVVNKEGDELKLAGMVEDYRPKWATAIQKTNNFDLYSGALLIVRHPSSGTIFTFVSDAQLDINNKLRSVSGNVNKQVLTESLNSSVFTLKTVDYCLNPNGNIESRMRADVRVARGASNSSGVTIVSDGNECNK